MSFTPILNHMQRPQRILIERSPFTQTGSADRASKVGALDLTLFRDSLKVLNMKWILNPLMLWGAILGFFIFSSLGALQEAWRHEGPGGVFYEQPDRVETRSEAMYKRHEYSNNGMMLLLGVFLWVFVAHRYRDDKDKK